MLKNGTTSGVSSSVVNIQGALVDTDQNADNYIRRIGLSGTQYGTTEETGVSNTATMTGSFLERTVSIMSLVMLKSTATKLAGSFR